MLVDLIAGEQIEVKILVLVCHPEPKSLTTALANAYIEGASSAKHDVQLLNLQDLAFDPILRTTYEKQELEPDLVQAQQAITKADHLAIFFPMWWYGLPALLKGFIDRCFTEGWAFRFTSKKSLLPEKLLGGRSAHVFYTMNTPPFIAKLIMGDPVQKAMSRGTLEFVGFKPVRFTRYGSVRPSSESRRKEWLADAKRKGAEGR